MNIKKMEDQGYLYCCTINIKDHYKIGKTVNLKKRLKNYKTSIINPEFIFTCPPCQTEKCFCDKTNKPLIFIDLKSLRERAVHKMLKEYRIHEKHEIFKCKLQDVSDAFIKVQTMNKENLLDYLKGNVLTPCKIKDEQINKQLRSELEGKIEVQKVEIFELTHKLQEMEKQYNNKSIEFETEIKTLKELNNSLEKQVKNNDVEKKKEKKQKKQNTLNNLSFEFNIISNNRKTVATITKIKKLLEPIFTFIKIQENIQYEIKTANNKKILTIKIDTTTIQETKKQELLKLLECLDSIGATIEQEQ